MSDYKHSWFIMQQEKSPNLAEEPFHVIRDISVNVRLSNIRLKQGQSQTEPAGNAQDNL